MEVSTIMATSTFTDPRSQIKIDRVLSLLSNTHMTKKDLAIAGAMSPSGAGLIIQHLKDTKRIYIVRWERSSKGRAAPYYTVGGRPNAPEPKRLGRKAYRQKAKSARKADPDKMAEHLSKRRLRDKIARTRKKPVTWLSALI